MIGILASAFFQSLELFAAAEQKPNIVYILCDDLGYGDVQCLNPQHGRIPTPNLDRLASQGMTFTEAHSSSAVCTPSRYSILTGRYNWRSRLQSGVLHNYAGPLIQASRLTVPAFLKTQGYQTAGMGKWHLGMTDAIEDNHVLIDQPIQDGPVTRGFDTYLCTDSRYSAPFMLIENDRFAGTPLYRQTKLGGQYGKGTPLKTSAFEQVLPDVCDRAIARIGALAKEGKPFFIYLAPMSPHLPIAPTPEWQGRSGLKNAYADYVMEVDAQIGRVLTALEKSGAAGNTLVIFTSDNGCAPYIGVAALEKRGHFPSELRRGYKADIWDGGHRIPFIARWPDKIKPGTKCDQLICLSDLMATCADMLGVKLPDNAGEDSVSILPAFLDQAGKPLREAIVHHSIEGAFAIRQGQWKLELCRGSGGWSKGGDSSPAQLYDMTKDVRERTNEYKAHPDIVSRLTKLLEKYIADGRSTPGAPQKNDAAINLWKKGQPNDETLSKDEE